VKDLGGHGGAVQHVCVCKDGSVFASTSDDDRTVRLWDLRSDDPRAVRCVRFRGTDDEEQFLSCACFGSGQDELFIACGSSIVKFDARESGSVIADGLKLPRIFTAEDEINELSYNAGTPSMDGGKALLAAADDTGAVTVVRASDGMLYRKLDKQHTNICSSVKWHPSEKTCLVSGALDSTIVTWDAHKKKCLARDKFAAAPGGANPPLAHCVDLSPDGNTVVTAVGDGSVVLSSWRQLRRTAVLAEGHAAAASAVCFMHNGKQVVSGGVDEAVVLWDAKAKRLSQRWEKQGKVNWIAAHPTQNAFFVASSNHSIRMFTLR